MLIAVAQMNPTVGDLDGNLNKILSMANEAAEQGAGMIICPAHALTGAPLDGLGVSPSFVQGVVDRMERIAAESPILVFLGSIVPIDNEDLPVAPAMIAVSDEVDLLGVPMLDEEGACPVLEIEGKSVAMLLENHFAPDAEIGSMHLLVEVCADAYGEEEAAPAAWGRLDRARSVAMINHAFVVTANLCGASDSMVFAGGSTVIDPQGRLLHACSIDSEELLVFDTEDITEDMFEDPQQYQQNPNEILWTGTVVGTRDYIQKNGFSDVVIGLSGGIDSAVVAAIAVDALGAEHVHGVLMPGPYSSEGSVTDAQQLAENLGISTMIAPINAAYETCSEALAEVCGGSVEGITAENLQARLRTVTLMAVSNSRGWIVLNTGNKSEAAMGFSTLYGDTVGAYAPIGDLYKSDVYDLARWRNTLGAEAIPQNCIDKAPSAELYPDATDQDRLPPYEQLDDLLFDYIEGEMSADELIVEGHDAQMVQRVLRAVAANEYKRRMEPPAAHVQGKALTSERGWPVTNAWKDA